MGLPALEARADNFHTRFRANDAPIAGRFTVYAYFLDSLDVSLNLPDEPGRPLLLVFADANGEDSFLIPADFSLEDRRGRRWTRGFMPVGEGRLGGFLPKDEARMALWWVPNRAGEFTWDEPTELTLWYGLHRKRFYPMEAGDVEKATRLMARVDLKAAVLDPGAPVDRVEWEPDPFAFDKPPEVWEFKQPEYPPSARRYDQTGMVRVVAQTTDKGYVTDVFVVQSSGVHSLNVAALVAVFDWRFRAGRKDNRKVGGDVLIPIRFSEAKNQ